MAKNQKPVYVYFLVDESLLSIVFRIIVFGRFKVKVGYSNDPTARLSTGQTINSRRIKHFIKPLRFSSEAGARYFETVCHEYLGRLPAAPLRPFGFKGKVHKELKSGREWFYSGLYHVLKIKFLYLTMKRKKANKGELLAVRCFDFFRFALVQLLNLPLWVAVFLFWIIAVTWNAIISDIVINFLDGIYKPFSPNVRKLFDSLSKKSLTNGLPT